MKDKKNKKIEAGDKIKVLWKLNNREYPGNVIRIKGNIALISVKNFMIYVNDADRLLKISA